jgi:hypothetical protein
MFPKSLQRDAVAMNVIAVARIFPLIAMAIYCSYLAYTLGSSGNELGHFLRRTATTARCPTTAASSAS